MSIRSVFMGSPEFAVPPLAALTGLTEVVGVVTQPDRPAGRGRTLVSPPVKNLADQMHLPVLQPETLRSPEVLSLLQSWQPDIIVVAAYGKILRAEILALPRRGCVNLHASLLPRHRGAAPIAAAILAGDVETGITMMQMDPGMDTGPTLASRRIPILASDTAGSLTRKLADLAAQTLKECLPVYIRGELTPMPQDSSQATYAPLLSKAAGALDIHKDAAFLERQIRAFNPWPGAYLTLAHTSIKVQAGEVGEPESVQPAGTLVIQDGFPAVHCGRGLLILRTVQTPGKRPMSGADFLRGARDFTGNVLS